MLAMVSMVYSTANAREDQVGRPPAAILRGVEGARHDRLRGRDRNDGIGTPRRLDPVEVLLEEGSRLIVLTHPIGNGSRTTASVSPVGERA